MTHDQLASSLAAHLRTADRMVWTDMQLGPSGSVRPDVYAIFKSYVRPQPMAFEVKVSTADYRADVTAGKWQTYLKFASGVYFACEGDLIKPADLPAHCGLIVFRSAWRTTKKATLAPVTIPQDALIKLLIDGVGREGPSFRIPRGYSESIQLERCRKKFGKLVADTVKDRLASEAKIAHAEFVADSIIKGAERRAAEIQQEARGLTPLRTELCEILGLPPSESTWRIQHAVRQIKRDIEANPAVENLRILTQSLRSVLDRNGYKEQP